MKPDEEEFRKFVVARIDMLRGPAFLTCGNRQVAGDPPAGFARSRSPARA